MSDWKMENCPRYEGKRGVWTVSFYAYRHGSTKPDTWQPCGKCEGDGYVMKYEPDSSGEQEDDD